MSSTNRPSVQSCSDAPLPPSHPFRQLDQVGEGAAEAIELGRFSRPDWAASGVPFWERAGAARGGKLRRTAQGKSARPPWSRWLRYHLRASPGKRAVLPGVSRGRTLPPSGDEERSSSFNFLVSHWPPDTGIMHGSGLSLLPAADQRKLDV